MRGIGERYMMNYEEVRAPAPAQILVIEDDAAIRQSLRILLESWGYSVLEAEHGGYALALLSAQPVNLILSDIEMPVLGGIDFLEIVRREYPQLRVIMVSGITREKTIDEVIARGAIGYVQKPVRLPELKSQILNGLRQESIDQRLANPGLPGFVPENPALSPSSKIKDIARLFVVTSDLHHGETGAHIQRIGKFSRLLAELSGMPALFASDLGEAAVLHDIGKLAIPDAILKKPGPLTVEEFEIMKTHPVLGGKILAGCQDPFLKLARTVALYHHERWDGSGYPEGLVGEDCPISARIVGVVDVFDALNEKRVYKEPWPRQKITNFFREKKGSFFEPGLIEALLGNYERFEQIRLSHAGD